MDEGRARLAGWDLTADDDDVWGLGLGCNGAIEVFIEPRSARPRVTHALREALEQERSICVVTALESGVAGVEPGARLVVRPDGSVDGSLGDADADAEATVAAKELLAAGRSEIRTFAGSVRSFVEVLEAPLRLGPCAAPGTTRSSLVRTAAAIGWHAVVVDDRPAVLTEERYPQAHGVRSASASRHRSTPPRRWISERSRS
jgi:xanthine dehydrogenase accessory factor